MEDNYSIKKIRIQKLSGPNYRSWMIQLQRLLIGKSLWDVVKYGGGISTWSSDRSGG
jgi:hypothetical protein